jgi:putative FmdB family regulatory protein
MPIENLGKNAEASQYSGTSWKVVLRQSNANFASVACAAAGRCTIVGSQSSAHLLDVIARSTTTAIDVTGPGAAQAGIACTSNVFCVGVNSVGETPTIPTAANYNGQVWAKSNIGSESFDTYIYDVACGRSEPAGRRLTSRPGTARPGRPTSLAPMPIYEFRCSECEARFEARRPADQSDAPAPCPNGHENTRRLLSVFATAGRSGAAPTADFGPSPSDRGSVRRW